MNRHGAIQLSMQMIVVLIISLVILIMGIQLLSNVLETSKLWEERQEERIWEDLNTIMDDGGPIAMAFNQNDATAGELITYRVGIRNLLDEPETLTVGTSTYSGGNRFRLIFSPSLAPLGVDVTSIASWITVINTAEWIPDPKPLAQLDKYIINGEKERNLIGISIPPTAEKGTYVFNVKVSYVDPMDSAADIYQEYAPIQKLYVHVH